MIMISLLSFLRTAIPALRISLPLVASSPDVHGIRRRDQFVAELGMGDGDDRLRLLPGGESL